jgi:hypothetical protein
MFVDDVGDNQQVLAMVVLAAALRELPAQVAG